MLRRCFPIENCTMCECALGSERFTKVLVACCNLTMSNQCYPETWLKILSMMLEKGKGPVLEKLRTTQLVEANFQLLMRFFSNERMVRVI